MIYIEYDRPLSAQLDEGGPLLPLLTAGEARAARYALWLLSQGDGPASDAAHELAARLARRLGTMAPEVEAAVPGFPGQQFGVL